MSMCMYLTPKGFRGDRPGWFLCTLTGKEVPKHRINNCVRGGCPDYRERDDEVVAGDKGKRIKWDEPANQTVPEASDVLTLREWARDEMAQGIPMNQLVKQIGCSWSTLDNAVKQPKKQPAPMPKPETVPEQEVGTCWNCRQQLPADSMHPDGDTLECEACYRKAHAPAEEPGTCQDCGVSEAKHVGEDGVPRCHRCYLNLAYTEPTPPPEPQPAPQSIITCWDCGAKAGVRDCPDGHPRCETCWKDKSWFEHIAAPTAARCVRCECELPGSTVTIAGYGCPLCEPCADAIRQEWETQQYPEPEPAPQPEPEPASIAQPRQYDTTETRRAAGAFLRHIGCGDQEVFALGIWLDAWAARGEAA